MKKIICFMLSLLLLSGCSSRREIDTLPVVLGFGIDDRDNGIEITSQIALPSNIVSNGGTAQKENSSPYVNLTSVGDYIFPAIHSSSTMLGSELYMAHNLLVVFGQKIAEDGLEKYMDFFLRDHELRMNMFMLVTDGEAKDILSVESDFAILPSIHIAKQLATQKETSLGVASDMFDFLYCLSSGRRSPLLPLIHIIENGDDKPTLQLQGTAVFSGDKMIGTLDSYETRGYLWATKNDVNTVLISSVYGEPVSIESLNSTNDIRFSEKNGKIFADIKVTTAGNIGSIRGKANLFSVDWIEKLEEEVSKNIKQEILAAVSKSKELKSDFFGFEDMLYKHNYDTWKKYSKNVDKIIEKIEVNVTVDTKILESGRIKYTIGAK